MFLYKYTVNENQFGDQNHRFLVADDYDSLFLNDAALAALESATPGTFIETDVYELDSVKQDLNTDEGSFAIDEFSFSINHANCETEDELKALGFVLDAADNTTPRFIAHFFTDDTPTTANLIFVGKILSKFSGEDQKWSGSGYNIQTDALRNYKFTALSFDLALLDLVSMRGEIEDSFGIPVENIHERLSDTDWALLKPILDYRLSHRTYVTTLRWEYNMHLASLYDVLDLLLTEAGDIITEVLGTTIAFDLQNSNLGIKTSPISYSIFDQSSSATNDWAITDQTIELTPNPAPVLELKINSTEADSSFSNPFVHRGFIDSDSMSSQEPGNIKLEGEGKQFDMMSTGNMANLLFAIAKAFSCYVFIEVQPSAVFNVTFKPLSEIAAASLIYIIGVDDASLDTTSVITKDAGQFYSQTSKYTRDGIDVCQNDAHGSDNLEPSSELTSLKNIISDDKDNKGIETERLLFSTGVALENVRSSFRGGEKREDTIPFNLRWAAAATPPTAWEQSTLRLVNHKYVAFPLYEHVITNIFVKTLPIKQDQIDELGASTDIWRPTHKITVEEDGENVEYDTLSDYANARQARDRQYYETEYQLNVPYWNAFSDTEDTSSIILASLTSVTTTATATTSSPHGLTTGDIVRIFGAIETNYNVEASITVTGGTTFTYTIVATTSPATGTPQYWLSSWRNIVIGSKIPLSESIRSFELKKDVALTAIITAITATAVAHGLITGDTVKISGANPAAYNGEFVVTVSTVDVFTYTASPLPPGISPATGLPKYAKKNLWTTFTSERTFVVVGLERSLSEPLTKLKLHNLSRFAFGAWTGDISDIAGIIGTTPIVSEGIIDAPVYEEGEIATGETVSEGDFVQILANGKYQKAVSDADFFGRTIGVAFEDAVADDVILIQTAGQFTSTNYSFTDLTNPTVYIRTSTGSNVSENVLEKININEDMMIIGGTKLSSDTILIGITERAYHV